MGSKGHPVCAVCTNNCLLFHRPKQTPPSPTCFFKVIAKQEHLTTLYIPPAFSSIVSHLVNKKVILNDSSGKQWNVEVSEVNGSFVFEEGWNTFSLDHGLKVGYFLVFNYIKDLHFDVKIYDTSACEKLDFSKKRNQKKRSRGKSGSPVKDGKLVRQGPNAVVVSQLHVPKMQNQRSKVDSVVPQNSKESGQLMCISEHCEDPYYSTSLEFDQSHGVDGTTRFANGDSKVPDVDCGTHIYQNDAIVCSKNPMFEVGMGAYLDISELEMSGGNTSLGEANKSTYDKTSTLELEANKGIKAIMYNREAQECQIAESLGEMKKVPVDMAPELGSSMDELNVTGEISEKSKKEPVTLDELGVTGLPEETKGELGHSSDMFNQHNESHFKTALTFSCVVPNDDVYLELARCLHVIRGIKESRQKKMVVLLRDPLRRLWPVFYNEKLLLLTHGWLNFSRANKIEPNDVCTFEAEAEAEDKYKRILTVHIAHKRC
ncbi:B3 domain-containing protein Os01g0905400 [Cajanus cajan]|uniref:B3 domain-containing protein Os01g0905400 n=1 Tax=Cajanus cajan TaxID=3821 RepID=UPI00098D9699|nr:B3 domain-containing protein Os01g0905400 [Cajanus cajan]